MTGHEAVGFLSSRPCFYSYFNEGLSHHIIIKIQCMQQCIVDLNIMFFFAKHTDASTLRMIETKKVNHLQNTKYKIQFIKVL